MSELENAELLEDAVEDQPIEEATEEEQADSAPAQEKEPNEVEELKKAIAEKAYKEREARRKAEELERRLKAFEEKQPKTELVDVPDLPDPFDDDYEQKLRARENALLERAKFEARESYLKDQQAIAERDKQRQELEASEQRQKQFLNNSQKLGIEAEDFTRYEQAFIDHINKLGGVKDPRMINMILDDPQGPLVVQHLAANPLDVDDLLHSDPYIAGSLYERIKSKAMALKPKTSRAPEPATIVEGSAPAKKDRGPEGAIFE